MEGRGLKLIPVVMRYLLGPLDMFGPMAGTPLHIALQSFEHNIKYRALLLCYQNFIYTEVTELLNRVV